MTTVNTRKRSATTSVYSTNRKKLKNKNAPTINSTLTTMDNNTSDNTEEFNTVEFLTKMKTDMITEINTRFTEVNTKLDGISADMEQMNSRVSALESHQPVVNNILKEHDKIIENLYINMNKKNIILSGKPNFDVNSKEIMIKAVQDMFSKILEAENITEIDNVVFLKKPSPDNKHIIIKVQLKYEQESAQILSKAKEFNQKFPDFRIKQDLPKSTRERRRKHWLSKQSNINQKDTGQSSQKPMESA